MDYNEFFRSIKEGRFENVYLFTGPEELSKREGLAKLRRALLPAGLEQLNDDTLQGCAARDIIAAAETFPVMCDRRVVVVRDWAPLASGKSKTLESEGAAMLEWIGNAPDTCSVVFYMTEDIDADKALAAALMKRPGYVRFEHLAGAALAKWCNQQLKPFGKRLSADAMEELSLMAGQELTRLSGELQKLAAYAGERSEIGIADVRAVVTPSPEYSAFKILDFLLDGNLPKAVDALNAELRMNNNVVQLINRFAGQLRIHAHVKYALENGDDLQRVYRSLGVAPKRARFILKRVTPYPAEAFKERYLACVNAAYEITSGRMKSRAALDLLMLKIVMPAPATKPVRVSSNR